MSQAHSQGVVTLLLEKDKEKESIVYCTVADANGSYHIDLTDSGGEVVTRFDRICIQYEEFVRETQRGWWREIVSRTLVHQVDSIEKQKAFWDVSFDTEFFLDANPTRRLEYFDIGFISRVCKQNHDYPELERLNRFGRVPEILPRAADKGILWIIYYRGTRC